VPFYDSLQKSDLEQKALRFGFGLFDIVLSIDVFKLLCASKLYLSTIVRIAKPSAHLVMSILNNASLSVCFCLLVGCYSRL
jgi:2-polyprenyl-3-methyl-5-hydroxy-6-metoxy-1,4-benzoquinol methylase